MGHGAWFRQQSEGRLAQQCAKEPRLQENSMSLLLQRTRFLSGGLAEVHIVTRQDIVITLKLIKK